MNNYIFKGNITPTVELNALAMKLGETPVYEEVPPVPPNDMVDMNHVPVAHFTVYRGMPPNYPHPFGHYNRCLPPPNRIFPPIHRPMHYFGRMAYVCILAIFTTFRFYII